MARSTRTAPNRAADSGVQTVSFVSLGCPKNLVDSEKMLGLLAESGLAVVSAQSEIMSEEPSVSQTTNPAAHKATPSKKQDELPSFGADAVVVNTCGFLEASKEESLSVIKDALAAKERGEVKRVVVAGCLVQRHRAKLLEWAPGIDALIGVFDRDRIVEAVKGPEASPPVVGQASSLPTDRPKYWITANALIAAKDRGLKTTGLTVNGKDGKGVGYFEDDSARLRLTPRHYAYLRVSEGCNQNCAFCTIPSIRGKMRSKPLDRVAAEARELIADGAFELNLIGQDTTSYGDDLTGAARKNASLTGLPALLKTVSQAFDESGLIGGSSGWVRLMYAYPSNFSDEMIDALASLSIIGGKGHILPYIDIPLQHASDNMLTAMRRNVTAKHQRGLMRKLRERIPGMSIRTTFISGFPGEAEDDHKRLLDFIEEVPFDALGVFEYSHEDGTVAGTMENDPKLAVPAEVKARRRDEVMRLQQRLAFERTAALAAKFDEDRPAKSGAQFDILIDRPTRTAGKKTTGVGKGGQLYQGRTYFQAPQIDAVTYVQSARKLSPGELLRCSIVAADGYDLIARPCDELERRTSLKILRA